MDQKWVEKYPYLFGPNAKDPDEGKGEIECTDVVAKLMEKFTGYGGTFSTWSERHAFIYAAMIGYNDVTSSADIPPVPEFWVSEAHYWLSGITMGRMAKKLEENAPSIKGYITAFLAGNATGVAGALKIFGA